MDPFDLRSWKGFDEAGGDISQPAIVDQIVIDSRLISTSHCLFVALPGKIADGHDYIAKAIASGVKYVLAKKEWSAHSPEDVVILRVADPLKAFQEIAGTYRSQQTCQVVAITGSHGKTMVKDLLWLLLKDLTTTVASPESFNSQIGVPLSLLNIQGHHKIALIEAGHSLPGEMETLGKIIQPTHAIVTHIGKKHVTTLGNLNTIAKETLKIVGNTSQIKWVLLPKVPHLTAHSNSLPCSTYEWNVVSPSLPHARAAGPECRGTMPYVITFPDNTSYQGLTSTGFYYFIDLLNIAVKAAFLLGAPPESIMAALKNYSPDTMNTEIWRSSTGPTFICEPYCSDTQSIEASLQHLQNTSSEERKTFVFGGMRGKHAHVEIELKKIVHSIRKASVDHLILYGRHDYTPLINELNQVEPKITISQYNTEKEALDSLRRFQNHNDIILIKGEHKIPIDNVIEIYNDSICSNKCIINLATVAENIATLRNKLPPKTRIMAIVKALAYGTDNTRMARFLQSQQIDILGVSYPDEGIALRRAGIKQPIFAISAALYEANKIAKWDMEVGVSGSELIAELARVAEEQKKKIKVHLHIDTGMGRFGCRPEEALSLARQIQSSPYLHLEGLLTHFACAEDPAQDAFTLQQSQKFDAAIAELASHGIQPKTIHAANTAGVMRFDFPQYNMVRIGLGIYGLNPSKACQEVLNLNLAISLVSRIVGINTLKKGESISYGRSYIVQKEMERIAVLPVGYYDGIHRNYSNKGYVIIHGKKAPMVGKICMDFMMIDVTDIPEASAGDSVLIFGEDDFDHYIAPEELATVGNSIVHELVTCLGPRIQRIFVYEETNRNR